MAADEFKKDVQKGLSGTSRYLSSKYFYDEKGSAIFEEIMRMPEYYLTRCEAEILKHQSIGIIQKTGTVPASIIEFGSGDGTKTIHLLKAIQAEKQDSVYVPVDLSAQSIDSLSRNIQQALPDQIIKAVLGDYFSFQNDFSAGNALFLFLGSNIGNYTTDAADQLLSHFYSCMKTGDHLLVGFDLQKDPATIIAAYDDPHGITKEFNLNLLDRINHELGADFNRGQFDFVVTYNEKNGELKSYLKSLEKQTVRIDALDLEFSFEANELIWTELSQKYTLPRIEDIAAKNQFRVKQHFMDSRNYFAVSLWQK